MTVLGLGSLSEVRANHILLEVHEPGDALEEVGRGSATHDESLVSVLDFATVVQLGAARCVEFVAFVEHVRRLHLEEHGIVLNHATGSRHRTLALVLLTHILALRTFVLSRALRISMLGS